MEGLTVSDARTIFPEASLHSPTGWLPGVRAREASALQPWQEALGHWLGRLGERDEMRGLSERERREAGVTAHDIVYGCRELPPGAALAE
jgi:hypothetical protein